MSMNSCFDCKSTKNLRAIHNSSLLCEKVLLVVSTAKVQKIWEQFTTRCTTNTANFCCFDCKSTKNLRAIHNPTANFRICVQVVSTAKVQKIWEQFTTVRSCQLQDNGLFRLQKYKKFESNSQPRRTKQPRLVVVSTAKVQKIWEQFTTSRRMTISAFWLFRLQKYKKFESNSQLVLRNGLKRLRCFDCKSTKNLRAIHNESVHYWYT